MAAINSVVQSPSIENLTYFEVLGKCIKRGVYQGAVLGALIVPTARISYVAIAILLGNNYRTQIPYNAVRAQREFSLFQRFLAEEFLCISLFAIIGSVKGTVAGHWKYFNAVITNELTL